MPMRPRRLVAACTSALFLLMTAVSAQDRFRVLAYSEIAEVSGLRILTIRDNQRSECYTLFIMESPVALDALPVPAPADEAAEESVQRIRDAAERRDRQLADLKAKAERSGFWDPFVVGRYETDRRKVEDEYEQALRGEIPGSYPWATPFPGMRNGGWEDAADAVRRAIVDPDPASTTTMTGQFARLDDVLRRLTEAPRLAASGPITCANGDAGGRTPAP